MRENSSFFFFFPVFGFLDGFSSGLGLGSVLIELKPVYGLATTTIADADTDRRILGCGRGRALIVYRV